jgi:hypothetical protein
VGVGELHRIDAAADRPEGRIVRQKIDEQVACLAFAAIPSL